MKTFYDIDFAQLYQQHLRLCNYHDVSAAKWDKKAEKFADTFVEKANSYTTQLLTLMDIENEDSVLDIGCGPGTLAIPLAKRCQHVYALDFSPRMLELLKRYQQQLNLPNITLLQQSWQEDWHKVPQADVVIASRSTLVGDLDDAIEKLTAKAKKRVYLTAITDRHFLDNDIFTAIGRHSLGFPTYIYMLNRLYQKGIEAEVRFIESCAGHFAGESYAEFEQAVEFSLGSLTSQEKTQLEAFYQARQTAQQPIKQGQRRWALLSWKV